MTRLPTLVIVVALIPGYVLAQGMDPSMPGMQMPVPKPAKQSTKPKPKSPQPAATARAPQSTPSGAMPGMAMPMHDHAGMAMTPTSPTAVGTDLPAGNAIPPSPPNDHYADRNYGATAMAPSYGQFQDENGGQSFSKIMLNLAELQVGDSHPGYRWEGEGWLGGDINRIVVKSEGEGSTKDGTESAEIQALYSRAIGPYFNLQAGLRQDIQPAPSQTYATLGFEGLAPYWFEVEGAAFVSAHGDALARLEGYYDQNITQRLILQPRAELNLAAQDIPRSAIGSGLTDAELGLRLRYEITREFAPYIGVSWETKAGRTADYSRAAGENPSSLNFVVGIRTWF